VSELFPSVNPETVCLQGLGDLLTHIKKLYPNITKTFTNLPDDLISVPHQLTTLLTSEDSGIKLPPSMIRDMLRNIHTTLADHQIHEAPTQGPSCGR